MQMLIAVKFPLHRQHLLQQPLFFVFLALLSDNTCHIPKALNCIFALLAVSPLVEIERLAEQRFRGLWLVEAQVSPA